ILLYNVGSVEERKQLEWYTHVKNAVTIFGTDYYKSKKRSFGDAGFKPFMWNLANVEPMSVEYFYCLCLRAALADNTFREIAEILKDPFRDVTKERALELLEHVVPNSLDRMRIS